MGITNQTGSKSRPQIPLRGWPLLGIIRHRKTSDKPTGEALARTSYGVVARAARELLERCTYCISQEFAKLLPTPPSMANMVRIPTVRPPSTGGTRRRRGLRAKERKHGRVFGRPQRAPEVEYRLRMVPSKGKRRMKKLTRCSNRKPIGQTL